MFGETTYDPYSRSSDSVPADRALVIERQIAAVREYSIGCISDALVVRDGNVVTIGPKVNPGAAPFPTSNESVTEAF